MKVLPSQAWCCGCFAKAAEEQRCFWAGTVRDSPSFPTSGLPAVPWRVQLRLSRLQAAPLSFAGCFSCRDCAHLAQLPPSPRKSHAGSLLCCQRKISSYGFAKPRLLRCGLAGGRARLCREVGAHRGAGTARFLPPGSKIKRRGALGLFFCPVLLEHGLSKEQDVVCR